ncbi:MAG: cohesin domain-containing protein [Caldilineaceae bacterium]|nr:cohesin domain-containing protein [Caldilineaceae bacterium]HRJ40258.1 cohesin domain-containing protein [Caldilineaceae bacterium]
MTNKRLFPIRSILIFFLVAAALAVLSGSAIKSLKGAIQNTSVVVSPDIVELTSTEAFTATIRVTDVISLYGVELDVRYDPSIVGVESFKPGSFLSADFIVEQTIDNNAGRASLAYTQIGNLPQSGSGDIALLTLRRRDCLGQTPLELIDVILSDHNGKAISYTLGAGQVQSGSPPTNRKVTGSIFHDSNQNGSQDSDEKALELWPVYLQRLGIEPTGAQSMVLSDPQGNFQMESLTCGRHQLWTRNGSTSLLTQTVDIPASTDLQIPALPLTGTLQYPLIRISLPLVFSK